MGITLFGGINIDAWITVVTLLVTMTILLTMIVLRRPGGYRFSDFLCIGLPVKVAFLAVSILTVNIVYPLTPLNPS